MKNIDVVFPESQSGKGQRPVAVSTKKGEVFKSAMGTVLVVRRVYAANTGSKGSD